ncbi:unnamed protein product [Rotaria sp. Silwood2]|nr:unnamed protein product [Rotaria sp. Silwood2]
MDQHKDFFFTKQFDNWVDFEIEFKSWRNDYYQPVNVKRHSIKYNEKTMKELFDRFRYSSIKYVCHHGGPIRRNTKNGSRPNQESARIDCEFYFKIKHDTELNKIVFMKNKNLTHNHSIGKLIYKNYSFIRNKELQENEAAYDLCKMLITANTSTYNNRKLIHEKFDINLTRKDVNNIKNKLKFNLIGNQSDSELLHTWIDNILNQNSDNSIKIKINENGTLECLYVQTMTMKTWFNKYSNILHLDSTFKINIENYQLYICLVQNAGLKGVPVAYCLMTTGNKDNLHFFYSAICEDNDITQTQVIMVDKDLTNLDILQEHFPQARILLCIFHVLKYLKIRVHELKISLTNRMNIMKNIRKLLYDNNMSAIYLKEIEINSEETGFYNYFEVNWLTCCEMWQTKFRKNLFNFNTDTNNHLERFNRTLKDRISPHMHISECVKKLIIAVEDAKAEEIHIDINLKRKIYNSDDSILLKRFGDQITNRAIELLRKQNEELKHKSYFIEEIEENKWKIGQKDEEKNNFITSSIINRSSSIDLLCCDSQFVLQNQLPCRHIIVLFDRLNDEMYEDENEIQDIISINKRWLKNPVDFYLNETVEPDSLRSRDSQFMITQTVADKNKILSSNDKYNMVKPCLDLLTARIIQWGTKEFNEHLKFLNVVLDLVNTNKHNDLYNYVNSLTYNCSKQVSREIKQDIFVDLPDDVKHEPTTEYIKFDFKKEVEQECQMEFLRQEKVQQDYEVFCFEEHEKELVTTELELESELTPKLQPQLESHLELQLQPELESQLQPELQTQLQPEANEEPGCILSKENMIFSYSPVVNPPGRPRGKASLVSYKQKCKKNNDDKINKKRTYKQFSPDLKTYNYKRNKKVDSVRDVIQKSTWLTDFHIYLFFELLHEQFPDVNGLCGPAQIKLYTGPINNSIFIFNANKNHWLTISNLSSNNTWKVYDSLSYPKETIIDFFKMILPNEEKALVSFENVQQQIGGNDCGLFALAFATSLCHGTSPSMLFYNQSLLREHYVQCIENNKIEPFPSKPKRGSNRNISKIVDIYLN